jgi:hypothetical protein
MGYLRKQQPGELLGLVRKSDIRSTLTQLGSFKLYDTHG